MTRDGDIGMEALIKELRARASVLGMKAEEENRIDIVKAAARLVGKLDALRVELDYMKRELGCASATLGRVQQSYEKKV